MKMILRSVIFFIIFLTVLGKTIDYNAVVDTIKRDADVKIIGGQLADEGEYPSMASVLYRNMHTCGGVIISENFVLTTAQCRPLEGETYFVRVGTNRWNESGTDHQPVNFIIHPNWELGNASSSDIAIIEVTPPIEFNENTQPSILPPFDLETPGGSDAVITGWGRISQLDPTFPADLYEAFIVVRDHQECVNIYQQDFTVTDAQICADVLEGGIGFCIGDYGGPMFVNGEFIGISSTISSGCAFRDFPGIYTRIASYRDWITEHTGI